MKLDFIRQFVEIVVGAETSPFGFGVLVIQTLAQWSHYRDGDFLYHPMDGGDVLAGDGKCVV